MKKFKRGDRVVMSPMWKYKYARGEVIKVTKEWVVVRWDGINGEWHYTGEQSKSLFREDLDKDISEMWKTWGDK